MTDRQQWLEERRSGIGGSDIAGILGLSPYATPLSVYLDKKGLSEPKPETEWQRMGLRLEGAILAEYRSRVQGQMVMNPENAIAEHPDFPYFLASYDARFYPGWVHLDKSLPDRNWWVVDAKNVGISRAKEWGKTGEQIAPQHVVLQMQWYMMISGTERADLAALIGGNDFRIITIMRDDGLIEIMQEAAHAFWFDHVLAGVPPELDTSHPTSRELVRRLYGNADGGVVRLQNTPALEEQIVRYKVASVVEARAKKVKEEASTKLLQMMGNASEAIVLGDGGKPMPVTLKRTLVKREAYTVPAGEYVKPTITVKKDYVPQIGEWVREQDLLDSVIDVEVVDEG